MLVVPVDVEGEFPSHGVELQWHDDPAGALAFHGAHEPFDNGDASVLANGTEARPNPSALAPWLI
jgi:hypothetical protein